MRKFLNLFALALVALFCATACSSDDNPTPPVDEYNHELPEEMHGVWTDQGSRKESATTGVLFTIRNSNITMRRFDLNDGTGADYAGTIKLDGEGKKGKITVTDANAPFGDMDVEVLGDSLMGCRDTQKGDTLLMTYVGKDISDHWTDKDENPYPYDLGDGVTEPINTGFQAPPASTIFDWLTPAGVFEKVAIGALSALGSQSFNLAMNALFGTEDTTGAQLEKISAQLNDIQTGVEKILENLEKNTNYTVYTDRMKLYTEFCWEVDRIFEVMNDPESDSIIIMANVEDFCNRTYRATKLYDATKLYITSLEENITRKPIQYVYDYIVYNTVPWEHMGYDQRLMLRLGDAALISKLAIINSLYWLYSDDVNMSDRLRHKQVDEISDAIKNYEESCERIDSEIGFIINGEVQRDTEYSTCQIAGAHFKIKRKYITHVPIVDRLKNNLGNKTKSEEWYVYSEPGKDMSQVKSHCLNESEVKAILDYYKKTKKNYTFAKILKEEALVEADSYLFDKADAFMILQNNPGASLDNVGVFTWDNVGGFYVRKAFRVNDTDPAIEHWRAAQIAVSKDWPWSDYTYDEIIESDKSRHWFRAWVERP